MFRSPPLDNERALTPAVGILLLLSITIILSLTAVTYISGLADDPGGSPTVAFEPTMESESGGSDAVVIMHRAGDTIDSNAIYVIIDGASCVGGQDDPDGRYNIAADFQMGPDRMSSGMTVRYGRDINLDGSAELCPNGTLSLQGTTFRVIWENPNGNTVELQQWTT